MRVLALVLTIVGGLYIVDCAKSKSNLHHCGRHRFFNETSGQCESCNLCGPGTYVQSKCKGSRDTMCRECPSGYYSTMYSKTPNLCRRCSNCGMREVSSRCTSKSDAKCGDCPVGTYWNYVKFTCTPCSFCFPEYAEYMAIEPSCENPQIPATHHCAESSWTPYKPPPLTLRVNQGGDAKYLSSKDVETSIFIDEETRSSKTISTKVRSTLTAIAPSQTPSKEDSIASLKEDIAKLTELYNARCSRTLVYASTFCFCALLAALTCLCIIVRKRRQYSKLDSKNSV